MIRDPRTQDHPIAVYLIGIFVWAIILFVLAGVVNHLAFSSHGPGLLIPLVEKFQKKEPTDLAALKKHEETKEHLHFHHFVKMPQLPENLRPACSICHTNLPHNKTKKIRSMLNMHTGYLACETCHLKENEAQSVVYQWYSPVEENPQGPFFGTAYDPQTGELEMAQDHFSQITPLYRKDGRLTAILHQQDAPMARDYVKIRDQLSPEQRKDQTKPFHVDVSEKSPECQVCHAANGKLDLKALGFSPQRIEDIEHLNIKGIITKYDEFYLPDLFK